MILRLKDMRKVMREKIDASGYKERRNNKQVNKRNPSNKRTEETKVNYND